MHELKHLPLNLKDLDQKERSKECIKVFADLASQKAFKNDIIFNYFWGIHLTGAKEHVTSEAVHTKLIKLAPTAPQIWDRLGNAQFGQDKLAAAITTQKKAVKLAEKIASDSKQISDYYRWLSVYLFEEADRMKEQHASQRKIKEKLLESEGALNKGLVHNPKNVRALILLAEMKANQDDEKTEMELVKKALFIDPANEMANNYMGIIYCIQKNYKEALPHFKIAAFHNLKFLCDYVDVLVQLGRYKEAAENIILVDTIKFVTESNIGNEHERMADLKATCMKHVPELFAQSSAARDDEELSDESADTSHDSDASAAGSGSLIDIGRRKEADKLLEEAFVIGIKQIHNKDTYDKHIAKARALDPTYYRPILIEAILTKDYDTKKYQALLKEAEALNPNSPYIKYHVALEKEVGWCPNPAFLKKIMDSPSTNPEDVLASAEAAGCKAESEGMRAAAQKSVPKFKEFLPTLSDNIIFKYFFGVYLNRAENWEESEDVHKKLTKLTPNIPQIWERLADAQFEQGNLTDAKISMCKAIELLRASKGDPKIISGYYSGYGVFLSTEAKQMQQKHVAKKQVTKKLEEAKAAFHEGLEYNSNNKYIIKELQVLDDYFLYGTSNASTHTYEAPQPCYEEPELMGDI
ncbi:MAG UNVERIFIED_CONTAM: hypothetical protein LVQ98_04800 [Rickettsiaceae bacterium]